MLLAPGCNVGVRISVRAPHSDRSRAWGASAPSELRANARPWIAPDPGPGRRGSPLSPPSWGEPVLIAPVPATPTAGLGPRAPRFTHRVNHLSASVHQGCSSRAPPRCPCPVARVRRCPQRYRKPIGPPPITRPRPRSRSRMPRMPSRPRRRGFRASGPRDRRPAGRRSKPSASVRLHAVSPPADPSACPGARRPTSPGSILAERPTLHTAAIRRDGVGPNAGKPLRSDAAGKAAGQIPIRKSRHLGLNGGSKTGVQGRSGHEA